MFTDETLDLILKFEGGKAYDKDDRGGRTNYGVTQATYNAWRATKKLHDKDVFDISLEEVKQIYFEFYWEPSKCEYIQPLDRILADIHVDCAINCGVGTANKMLQEVAGVTKDGVIGPKTLAAIRDATRTSEDRLKFRTMYLAKRLDYYIDITVARPVQSKFMPSWARRVYHLLLISLE